VSTGCQKESAGTRSRRMRERRRRGVVAVVPLEIMEADLLPLMKSGLSPISARAVDRAAIAVVVRHLLNIWVRAWYERVAAQRQNSDDRVRRT
jgi:hypothetical protein